jgi:uncharacterized membrane protein YraQ (UPF0718 family)
MDTTIPQLMREIAEDIQEVLRSEIRLAKVELGEQVNRVKKASKGALPGAVLLFYMVGFFLLACMFALELVLAAWLAALIVAIVAGIVAAMMLGPAIREAKMVNPTPERTIQTMKENVQWAKSQLR